MVASNLVLFLVWSSFIPINYCSLIPMKEKLHSWVEITNFQLTESVYTGGIYKSQMSTNDPRFSVVSFSLEKSEAFYNPKLSHRLKDCFYEGHVSGVNFVEIPVTSPARLKFCSGALSGLVHFGNDVWNLHTEPDQSWIMFTSHMILQDNSSESVCGTSVSGIQKFEETSPTNDNSDKELTRERRSTNQNAAEKFVEIIIFHDYEYYEKYGLSEEEVNDRAIKMIHTANGFFAELKNPKVSLTLVDVIIWKTAEEKPDGLDHGTIGGVLGPFLNWRFDNLDTFLKHDNGIFISGAKYTGGVVGMANMGTLCRESHSGSVLSDHSEAVGVMAGTLAHELGHNFNLGHNPTSPTDECACEQGDTPCVMNSGISSPPVRFTQCQLKNIQEWIVDGNSPCLNNRPELKFGDPFCGDFFVNQDSEECDCGPANKTCQDDCCEATTCKLKENADCSSFDLCCDQWCKVKTEGSVCRKDTTECDLPEYCDGRSSSCPEDVYIQNGERCKNNNLASHCFYGQCLTVYDQCLNVFSPKERIQEVTDEKCWAKNLEGNEHGNCGLTNENGNSYTFHECSPHDSRCGKLQCASSQDLDVSWNPASGGGQKYKTEFDDVNCFLVDSFKPYSDSVDDFSYVQDGTWCADESICVARECINITNIPGLKRCPQRCNGNGLCNSNNNCHCNVGWRPPLCDVPGNGGSIDSGPASETPNTSSASKAIMVLFLLIIPIFIIIGVLVFVFRHPIRKFAREKYTQYFSTFPASVPEGQNRASTSPKRHQPQSGKDNRRDRYSFKPGTAVSSSQQSQFAANSKSAVHQPSPKKRLPQASDFAIQFDSVLFKPSEDDIVTSWGVSDKSVPVPAPRALTKSQVNSAAHPNNQLALHNSTENNQTDTGLPPPPPQSVSLRNFAAN